MPTSRPSEGVMCQSEDPAPHRPGRLMAGQSSLLQTPHSLTGTTQPSQEIGFALYSCQRSIKTSSYPPGGMCGTTSSDSRSIKRQWSSRRLRQLHSPPHRTMLQQFASPGSSQGASLPTMQGKSRVSTTGWPVLSMSTFGSSTSPPDRLHFMQICEMLRSS